MGRRYVIAGCGYVGAELAGRLAAQGYGVTGLTGSRESAEELGKGVAYRVCACDLGDGGAVARLAGELGAGGTRVDGVVHCASSGRGGEEAYRRVYLEGMRHLAEAFPWAHLVFTSSTSVYPQADGSEVDEGSEAGPVRGTGKILVEAEEVVLRAGGTVARLAGIYGPGRWYLLKKYLEGTAAVEVREDAPDGRYINSIHRDDAASALEFLLVGRLPGIFNVVDDVPMEQRAAYAVLAEHFKKGMPPDAAPDLDRKRGWTHKRVSNRKLREAGWEPEFGSIRDAVEMEGKRLRRGSAG